MDWNAIRLVIFIGLPLWLLSGWIALSLACRRQTIPIWALLVRSALVQLVGVLVQCVVFLLAAVPAAVFRLGSGNVVWAAEGAFSLVAYGLTINVLAQCGRRKALLVSLVQGASTFLLVALGS